MFHDIRWLGIEKKKNTTQWILNKLLVIEIVIGKNNQKYPISVTSTPKTTCHSTLKNHDSSLENSNQLVYTKSSINICWVNKAEWDRWWSWKIILLEQLESTKNRLSSYPLHIGQTINLFSVSCLWNFNYQYAIFL